MLASWTNIPIDMFIHSLKIKLASRGQDDPDGDQNILAHVARGCFGQTQGMG